jgi:hypothetical protein
MTLKSYRALVIQAVANAPKSRGTLLARLAIKRDISVVRVCQYLGATRPTVYAWFRGEKMVSPAYREKVDKLVEVLRASPDHETAVHNMGQT